MKNIAINCNFSFRKALLSIYAFLILYNIKKIRIIKRSKAFKKYFWFKFVIIILYIIFHNEFLCFYFQIFKFFISLIFGIEHLITIITIILNNNLFTSINMLYIFINNFSRKSVNLFLFFFCLLLIFLKRN
jgi:hypothetical protein